MSVPPATSRPTSLTVLSICHGVLGILNGVGCLGGLGFFGLILMGAAEEDCPYGNCQDFESSMALGMVLVMMVGYLLLMAIQLWMCFQAAYNLYRGQGRVVCLVIAALECLIFPLGTILGIATLVVLNQDEVKPFFLPKAAGNSR